MQGFIYALGMGGYSNFAMGRQHSIMSAALHLFKMPFTVKECKFLTYGFYFQTLNWIGHILRDVTMFV